MRASRWGDGNVSKNRRPDRRPSTYISPASIAEQATKDDPALKEMQRALGHRRSPAIDEETDHADPETVHSYRDRYAG